MRKKIINRSKSGGIFSNEDLEEYVVRVFGEGSEVEQGDGMEDYWDGVVVGNRKNDRVYHMRYDKKFVGDFFIEAIEFWGSYKDYCDAIKGKIG